MALDAVLGQRRPRGVVLGDVADRHHRLDPAGGGHDAGGERHRTLTPSVPSIDVVGAPALDRLVGTVPAMTTIAVATATAEPVAAAMAADGYCIVEGVLSAAEVAEARASLVDVLAATPTGRNSFEGFATQRVHALFAKTRAFDAPAVQTFVLSS